MSRPTRSPCCGVCGIPVDAETFDVSGFLGRPVGELDDGQPFEPFREFDFGPAEPLPRLGEQKVLASFQLHSQYCGILTCFAQYTDLYARDNSQILTPGFEWIMLQNGKPIFPYTRLEMIVNPWGYNNFTFTIRLDENARVELVIRNRAVRDPHLADYSEPDPGPTYPIHAVAGRLIGRYWYNFDFGAEVRPRDSAFQWQPAAPRGEPR